MRNFRLVFIQMLLAILAVAFTATISYERQNASVQVFASGESYKSNITFGDLATNTINGGVNGR